MNKKHWMLAVSLIVLSLVATACGGTAEKASDELFKVAFVYVGPVGDLGGATLTISDVRPSKTISNTSRPPSSSWSPRVPMPSV